MKKIFRGAVVLLIAAAMFLSTIAVTANTNTIQTVSPETHTTGHESYSGGNTRAVVLWDNGMHYNGMYASQWDPVIGLDPIPADDSGPEKPDTGKL